MNYIESSRAYVLNLTPSRTVSRAKFSPDMLNIVFWYAAAAAVGLSLTYAAYSAYSTPLRDIPGPFLARFTRLWYLRTVWSGNAHHINIALHRDYAKDGQFYAPIVRLGPGMYSITRPDKAVYGIGAKMPKSTWYNTWKHPDLVVSSLFPERDMKRHAEARRIFQSMYSMSSLLHFEPLVEATQAVFHQRLTEMSKEGKVVDMHHWLQSYAFDVIGNITYSRRFGFLDEGKDVRGMMASLGQGTLYSSLVGVYAWAHRRLFYALQKIPNNGASAITSLMDFVTEWMAEKESERAADEKAGRRYQPQEGVPRDFTNLSMDAAQDPEKKMTPAHVFAMSMSNVVAGSDTTAISLSSILWHLTSNPYRLSTLRAELDQAIRDGKMTPDRISFKESQTLPYLQACIKEALRMCAATGLPLWRVVPQGSGGVEVMGRFFPEGSEIGINTWVAHYDRDIWGDDAAEYRPERWLESSPERLKEMEAFFMPVSRSVVRVCFGCVLTLSCPCSLAWARGRASGGISRSWKSTRSSR
jgi:cytochrome P450